MLIKTTTSCGSRKQSGIFHVQLVTGFGDRIEEPRAQLDITRVIINRVAWMHRINPLNAFPEFIRELGLTFH